MYDGYLFLEVELEVLRRKLFFVFIREYSWWLDIFMGKDVGFWVFLEEREREKEKSKERERAREGERERESERERE